MAGVTQPLRAEHQELLPHIESLREIAGEVGVTSTSRLRADVDEALEFLEGHLVPHAHAEEAALYPVVARVMGAPAATATMSRDHVEVGRYVQRLIELRDRLTGDELAGGLAHDLRGALYGLYALLRLHFAKEEEVYLPLLDERLTQNEAVHMFEAMEEAAAAAKRGSTPEKLR